MILTLHRSRWLLYHGSYAAVDAFEWSFARIEPSRTVRDRDEHTRRSVMVREHDADFVVVTPPLGKMVQLPVCGENGLTRPVLHVAFYGEIGLDAESVMRLATKGERGFKMKKIEQPSLFGDEPAGPTGAYGRRPPREDRVTPVAAELKAHAAKNDTPPWMPPAKPVEPIRTVSAQSYDEATCTERVSAATQRLIEADSACYAAAFPSRVPQHDVDGAGVDLAGDIEKAIHHVERGSGATAIAILRRVREQMTR